jgi:hypothetical protein
MAKGTSKVRASPRGRSERSDPVMATLGPVLGRLGIKLNSRRGAIVKLA